MSVLILTFSTFKISFTINRNVFQTKQNNSTYSLQIYFHLKKERYRSKLIQHQFWYTMESIHVKFHKEILITMGFMDEDVKRLLFLLHPTPLAIFPIQILRNQTKVFRDTSILPEAGNDTNFQSHFFLLKTYTLGKLKSSVNLQRIFFIFRIFSSSLIKNIKHLDIRSLSKEIEYVYIISKKLLN